jgi:acetylornithine deacetylase/succinyl-diaminopimelate desuccinylase-like protein
MGVRRGAGTDRSLIAIVAHIDTVFPATTDLAVKREGTRLTAPGVGDNTRSLAVLLAIIRAMNEASITTADHLLFVGNVGEEGRGDLRGVRYLLQQGKYKDRIRQVIAVDGAGDGSSIVHGGVASRRFRVVFTGPGGHSYGAFGLVSPAFAMGAAMQKFGRLETPASPKTTYSVGVVGGGTSVNSLPFETWMDVDMRSESPDELAKLEAEFRRVVQEAVAEENAARSTRNGNVSADLRLIGDRPGGLTPADAPLVQIAAASARAQGLTPELDYSSTDANLPISLGIPAIRLNSGGSGGDAHALTEWIDVEPAASLRGIKVLLAAILAVAGT